ncbi:MAG TPA: Swt1 family HEPN domain-containing protein [Accumulibacter sp.]|uniref:Swt1 family HEPN domain-containing protein n=1 Tax=Accumulibacter sp. TaxID=2053492 RepID=UPI002C3FD8DB|nr:Swt1 family HEPN domain-containing protein [Accumulibacter sp.]HNJ51104.1 Swt1 family HEPN domain-containing protein [Accumulibacter sp.]
MAITNHERVGKALELLKTGVLPFIERELKAKYDNAWAFEVKDILADTRLAAGKGESLQDVAASLVVMDRKWGEVFRQVLGKSERSLVNELLAVRNAWAHQEPFSSDDAYRALDSAGRLLAAISAPQADDVEKMKMELLRVRFDEQARSEKRKSASTAVESGVAGNLKPWREVVMPHADVASGRYQQAEFAADLWQVHLGEGSDEYRDPVEFFRRTYLTESLQAMLVGAVKRLTSGGGDPVVQLQTNFGGGKTHSMLALYHLFSGIAPTELAGIDEVMAAAGASRIPPARRVVLVGNKISPGNPATKPDGSVVRTLWGELAWQLGGKAAFARLAADDEQATSPGDVLRALFNDYGPCVILVDEWVAYARQLHDQSDLPAGSFETQFSFAQVLTESAKLARNCLLVISLPASETAASPHAQANDVEVGGTRGREALDRLRNVVGRVESSWRPASAEEGFEIVRRRLFQPLADPAQFRDRDVVARAFADFYRAQQAEFPPECRESDYEKRIRAAYPIHPEVFDRLYADWSTLVKFQRTRGVLRLMAAVIHSLWEKGERNPLILPGNVAIDDARVQSELTRYLSDNWVPVIEKDVDGPNSLPLKLDRDLPNLGRVSACRRVARAIYLGSAPTTAAAHQGIEDRRVKLGCAMPGESPAVFGDALRRMAGAGTYLYQDGPHYWYSTQPTVTKLAEDRAEQFKRNPDRVAQEIEKRLRKELERKGDFPRIHPMPATGADVPDDVDARLVVLGVDRPYSKESNSAGELAAKAILEARGNAPRLYRNTLVFLAADRTRLQDLDEAARKYLAWESILSEKVQLNLTPYQVTQAETQKSAADGTVTARLPETYQWLLVPAQGSPQAPITWQALRLSGSDSLAARASRKLRSDDLYLTTFASTRLRLELERIPLWRGNHVAVKQLVEDFAAYPYLPRLRDANVLLQAINDGVGLLTWAQDGFAFADRFDDAAGRYLGLRAGQMLKLTDAHAPGLLVKPDVAARQLDGERAAPTVARVTPDVPTPGAPGAVAVSPTGRGQDPGRGGQPVAAGPKRYHGAAVLEATRVGRDASRIADEVIAHLVGLVGARVTVTIEVEAEIPGGAPDKVVRTVTENARTLKFTSQGFEQE